MPRGAAGENDDTKGDAGMFDVMVLDDETGDWTKGDAAYEGVEDAIDDYGDENVRAVVPGKVFSLHEDERGDGALVGLLVLAGL